ncbi:MAG: hypothetical protein K0Q90_4331 [Paenibacillaceae bacterium]|jgi:HD-GYP domain-containing protein (c-di-GMP phosphodiesterase class II)|nr:hypothetical protein [Paenibacillaceae bacterium]
MPAKEYEELIGKQLTASIYGAKGTMLIGEGTILLQSHIEKLANFKIKAADVEAVEVQEPEPELEPELEVSGGSAVDTQEKARLAGEHLNHIDFFVHQNSIVPLEEVEEKILPYIRETAMRYNVFQVFSELKNQGDYRYKQILGVAVMATALGKRLQMEEEELALLSTAAILYDIGSVQLPSSLINKSARFDTHDYAIMKQHTVLGHELLIKSGVDPRIAAVALEHHEREDGSGYPKALKGEQIGRLSKIIALADVYMALTSDRPHRPAFTFFDAVNEIHQQIIYNRLDSVIGFTFLDLILSKQTGCDVILSDDRRGKILLTNVNYPTQPLIVLENNEFMDLSKVQDVRIKEVVG